MNPEIIDRDEFIVVGIRTVLEAEPQTTSTLWTERFLPRQGELNPSERRYYSVFSVMPAEIKGGRYEYVAGISGTLENIPDGMVGWLIPSGKYAQIKATGLKNIASVSRTLVTDWLPDSGYSMTSGVVYAYTDDEHPESESAVWKINIPVETPEVLEELKKWLV